LISCGVSFNSSAGAPSTVTSVRSQVAVVGEDGRLALGEAVGVAKQHPHPVRGIVHLHVLIGHARIAQRGAKILLVVVEQLLDRALHVDLIHEVDAAAQIQAQLQRAQAEIAHPFRNARGLRQRDGELIGTRLGDDVARLQLILLAAKRSVRRP
jgi:hypothetical protein